MLKSIVGILLVAFGIHAPPMNSGVVLSDQDSLGLPTNQLTISPTIAASSTTTTGSSSTTTPEAGSSATNPTPSLHPTTGVLRTDLHTVGTDTKTVVSDRKNLYQGIVQKNPTTVKQGIQTLHTDKVVRQEDLKDLHVDFEASRAALRQQFSDKVAAMRQEAQAHFKVLHDQFELKLTAIKDEKKKEAVTSIDTRVQNFNKNRTDIMTKNLNTMDTILTKLQSRVDALQGVDTASVESAITAAQKAISDAQAAVTAQAGKNYVVNLTTESKLGQDVRTTTQSLTQDMKATQAKVDAARTAVRKALEAAGKLAPLKDATESGKSQGSQ